MSSELLLHVPHTRALIDGVCCRDILQEQLQPVSTLVREGEVAGASVLIECREPRLRPEAVGVFYRELTALLVGCPALLIIAGAPDLLQHTFSGLTRHFADRTSIVFADAAADAHGCLLRYHLRHRLPTPVPFRPSHDPRLRSHPTVA